MSENILEMRHINKSFFGNQVLTDVNFDVRKGEVHCLLGENGAGKSTLIKILSGAYVCESGEIILDGQKLENITPSSSIQAGISVVYQELNMMPDLPIYENVFIGKEFTKGIRFDRKRQIQETQRYLDIVGLNVDPRCPGGRAEHRPAADGRDRQGHLQPRQGAGAGRAHRLHHGQGGPYPL